MRDRSIDVKPAEWLLLRKIMRRLRSRAEYAHGLELYEAMPWIVWEEVRSTEDIYGSIDNLYRMAELSEKIREAVPQLALEYNSAEVKIRHRENQQIFAAGYVLGIEYARKNSDAGRDMLQVLDEADEEASQ